MRILFVHQNFPGQYRHIINALAAQGGHQLAALGINKPQISLPLSLAYRRYKPARGSSREVHPLALDFETKVIRAEACARAAHRLRDEGFSPDLICAHPGWGEALFLRDIWPQVPLLSYQEFYYRSHGFDSGFDPEFQGQVGWQADARLRAKNVHLNSVLESSSWNVTPTQFQRSSFPEYWQPRISVIHDGINTERAAPSDLVASLQLPDGSILRKGDAVITFVNRCIEPYRGCHTFIRAIPELQRLLPDARIVIVGKESGVSYGKPCEQGEYKDLFLAEIEGRYNPSNVYFVGTLPYDQFLRLLQVSAVHVYLTYPFVLSWSLLEAMSCGCGVVGSSTAPVQEVIRDGENGLLVDFFKPNDVAAAVFELVKHRELAARLGAAARQTILERYSLEGCLSRQLALMQLVASRALGG